MSTALDTETDLALMFGAAEEVPCDSPYHVTDPSTHSGPATHYLRINHECKVLAKGSILVICTPMVRMVNALDARYGVHCEACWQSFTTPSGWGEVTGEIGK